MIKVRYERYWNDFIRKNCEITFCSLSELEDWIFDQMQQDYTKSTAMYFPTPETAKRIHADGPSRIEFTPRYGSDAFWIHQIDNHAGTIFTDGTFTSGQKHWSKEVQDWLTRCNARQRSPKFRFVD